MKQTIQKINTLLDLGIIEKYAIAGGMAHFYYIEPSVTYDLDLIVQIPGEEKVLDPLTELYRWAKKNHYKTQEEYIIIDGIPVQFLLAYNELVKEALDNRDQIKIYNEISYILKPEYLMSIMLQTNRGVDKERFMRFLNEAEYNEDLFLTILKKYNLLEPYKKLIKK